MFEIEEHLDAIAILCAVIFYSFRQIYGWLMKKKKPTIDDNMVIDSKIYPILWSVINHYRATRVFIFQFHNGQHFYTGQSIQRMTVSHEVTARGIQKLRPTHDNILVPEWFQREMMDIKADGIKWVSVNTALSTDPIHEWLQIYSIKSSCMIRLINKSGETVAVLGIHWNFASPVNDIEESEIFEERKRLETIFNEI